MKLRNTNPIGDVFLPALGQEWPDRAVFEVPDDLGEDLLLQVDHVNGTRNFERVEDSEPRENRPGVIERMTWPTPPWWRQGRGFALLLLRCSDCHKPVARFLVTTDTLLPQGRYPSLPRVIPVGIALANGRWARTTGPVPFENRVTDPCTCDWSAFPLPCEPHMRRALVKVLKGSRPPRVTGQAVRRLDPHPRVRVHTIYDTPKRFQPGGTVRK